MRPSTMTNTLVAVGLLHGACAHESTVYEPDVSEMPAVPTYPVPATEPKGTIYVLSLGGESLPSQAGAMEPYLHLRIAAENARDSAPWVLDANEQSVSFAGGSPVRPSFAQASIGSGPLTLAAGQRGELDLFYAMPSMTAPMVTLSWQVHRGAETSAEATSFARIATAAAPGRYETRADGYHPVWRSGIYFDYGPGWWWGPDLAFAVRLQPWFFGWYPRHYHPYYLGRRRGYVPPPRPPRAPAPPAAPARPAPVSPATGKSDWRGGGG